MVFKLTTHSLLTALLKVLAFWVLLVAAYLALGRQFFPYIERYNEPIAMVLSEYLGVEVEIGELSGDWARFNPILEARNVRLGEQLSIERILVEPSALQSLVNLTPIFNKLELDDVQANLQQSEDGWQFSGLGTAGAGETFNLQALLQLLRQQSEVRFSNARLFIQPRQLPEMTVVLDRGQLTGFGRENWLLANATVLYEELEVPIELQIESIGNNDEYDVDLYASHGRLDFAPWLQSQLPDLGELTLAGEYWVRLEGDNWQEATARWFSPRVSFSGRTGRFSMLELETEAHVQRQSTGFDLWFNHLGHLLQTDESVEPRQAGPTLGMLTRRHQYWQWQWDQLSSAPIAAWMSLNDNSGFWQNAAPQGLLTQLKGSLRGTDFNSLRITSDVEQGQMTPYAGIPGLDGIAGAFRLEGQVGRLTMDSTDAVLDLPGLYQDSITLAHLGGEMDLRWHGRGVQLGGLHPVQVNPDPTQLEQGQDILEVDAQWFVDLPITGESPRGERELNVRLDISAGQANLPWVMRMTPDAQLPGEVKPWMLNNLREGDLSEIGFSYSTSFVSGRQMHQSLSLIGQFENLALTFDEQWPLVERGAGVFALNNDRLSVQADQAVMAGINLEQGDLSLPFENPSVQMTAQVNAPAESALALFQTGPLAAVGSDVVSQWQASGQTRADLDLFVPFNGDWPDVTASGRLDNVAIDFPEFDLRVDNVSGDLNYSPEQGLYASELTGLLFDQPLRAQLSSDFSDDAADVRLSATGLTSLAAWGDWLNEPWLRQQDYVAAVDSTLRFTNAGTHIVLNSDLRGVPLALPPPLGKTEQAPADLMMTVSLFSGGAMTIAGNLDEQLRWRFNLDENRVVQRGRLAYRRPLPELPEQGVFIDADLDQADGDLWWEFVQQMVALYLDEGADKSDSSISWLGEVRVRGSDWRYLGLPWTSPNLSVRWSDEAWLLDFAAIEGAGQVLIPHEDQPLFVNLEFLALSSEETQTANTRPDPLRELKASDIPAMNVQIASLSYNDRELGNWRTEIRREEQSIIAHQILGQFPGANMTGQLQWDFTDQGQRSAFVGQVTTGNINTLLRSWDYAPVLNSQDGRFNLDLNWPGSPAYFDFSRLRGAINLRLNNGAILELEEYEGVKLIGLLNFTRVLRRLALDFTDLIRDGITFDVIEGELLFDRGFARVGEQLIIDGPATKFRFSGDADLVRDQLDVDMVMIVPLSSTFPLVALLAGVSPQAAAAIFVTERVFNNELERLSSARMRITGSLDSPEVRFYRVSDTTTGGQPADRSRAVVPGVNN